MSFSLVEKIHFKMVVLTTSYYNEILLNEGPPHSRIYTCMSGLFDFLILAKHYFIFLLLYFINQWLLMF